MLKHLVKADHPQHAVHSQAVAGTQVDASVLCLGSTLTQTALGTGWLLCHKAGRQPTMLGRVELNEFYGVAVWTQRPLGDKPPIDHCLTVAMWGPR